jgi:hypothetical protein
MPRPYVDVLGDGNYGRARIVRKLWCSEGHSIQPVSTGLPRTLKWDEVVFMRADIIGRSNPCTTDGKRAIVNHVPLLYTRKLPRSREDTGEVEVQHSLITCGEPPTQLPCCLSAAI